MLRKTASIIVVSLLVISALALAYKVQPVRASGTVYIRADGSIDPLTAPIFTADNITYTLTGNITSDADGIVIERDNVTLDGAGYNVQGPNSVGSFGITLSRRTNVTVKNTQVIAFQHGIYLDSSSNRDTVCGNNITNNNYTFWNCGVGIDSSSSNNIVSGNNITNNCDGIWLDSSSNNVISENDVINSWNSGMRIYFSSNNNSISGNNVTGNYFDGIIIGYSSGIKISGNNVTNNGCGIDIGYSSNISVSGNNVANNDYGIALVSSSNNTISENNVANKDYGIALFSSSSNNSISKNNVANNGYGIWLDSSSNNLICHNNFIGNTQQVSSATGSMNAWDDGYPSGGNYWSGYNGLDLYGGPYQNETGSDGIGDAPYVIDMSNQDNYPLMHPWVAFENQTIYIRADGSIDPSTAPIYTSDNITYVLTGNITSYVDGIVIERDNIVIDGAGCTIEGPGWNSVYKGMNLIGRSNVTIKSAEITGFDYGIWLNSSSGNSIAENIITANKGYGIYLYGSSNSNSISRNGIANNVYGMGFFYSSGNSISENDVTANNDDGIVLGHCSSNNSISSNNITNNPYGLWLYDSSNYNSISGNNITANNGSGIELDTSSNNSISGNDIAKNGHGVCLVGSCNNSISGNDITANNYRGIWLRSSSGNSIAENSITANNVYGIELDASSNDNILGNNITANNGYGIVFVNSSSNNTISGNNITANNGSGIELDTSSNNSVSGNNVTANNGSGILLLYSSSNNTISGNNVTANNVFGLGFLYSSDNSIYHNNFVNNEEQGCSYESINAWDGGYPSGGNYWGDYGGTDLFSGRYQDETGSDGIGDTPYTIDSNNQDNYPLMGPFSNVNAISTVSNSTISGFQFSGTTISFNVTGPPSTTGFCTLTILHSTLPPPYIVTVDGSPIQYTNIFENDTISIIYFTYQHSTHEVTIASAICNSCGCGSVHCHPCLY